LTDRRIILSIFRYLTEQTGLLERPLTASEVSSLKSARKGKTTFARKVVHQHRQLIETCAAVYRRFHPQAALPLLRKIGSLAIEETAYTFSLDQLEAFRIIALGKILEAFGIPFSAWLEETTRLER